MDRELVSIIVPVYNAENYLDRCVQSLINQTYPSIEVILVDDGSTDKSLSICERYADEYSNVKVFHTENRGPSSARNLGIEQSSGDYIQFADSDDYLELDMVEKMVDAKKTSQADIVICGYIRESENTSEQVILESGVYTFSDMERLLGYWTVDPIIGSQCNKLFEKKNIINNNIRYHMGILYAEDFSFCLDYMRYCQSFCAIPLTMYHYCIDTHGSLYKVNHLDVDRFWNDEMLAFESLLNLLKKNHADILQSVAAQDLFSYFATVNFYQRVTSKGIFHSILWARKNVHRSPYRLLIKKTKKIPRARGLNVILYLLKLFV